MVQPDTDRHNAQSVWRLTAPAPVPTAALDKDLRIDAAVIGGGYCGLSAALHLAEAGASVAVLEAHEPGWGASGRNGGQVIAGFKRDPDEIEHRYGGERGGAMVQLGAGAADFLFALVARLKIDCNAYRGGWISAAHIPAMVPVLADRVRQWQARGAPVELLSAPETARRIGTVAYGGGMLDRRCGTLHPLTYARGLAGAAVGAGAALFGSSPVGIVSRDARGWRLAVGGHTVTAATVVIATNAYGGGIDRRLDTGLVVVSSYQVATKPLPPDLRARILPDVAAVSDTRKLLSYYRLDPEGRLVMGGRGSFTNAERPDLYRVLERSIGSLFPAVRDVPIECRWSGRVALTRDSLPRLIELAPGLLAAGGYNGRGVAMSTLLGKLLADRILGADQSALPIATEPLRRYPLHALRLPAMNAALLYHRLRDALPRSR